MFPGVGTVATVEEVLAKAGLVLAETRLLDPATNTRVEAWMAKR